MTTTKKNKAKNNLNEKEEEVQESISLSAIKDITKRENEFTKSIRLPQELWIALAEDARRNKRTTNGQLEFVLSVLYGVGQPDLAFERLITLKELYAPQMAIKQ
jgi:hypothetical protein